MSDVTLVTKDANTDDLDDKDYRGIYEELRALGDDGLYAVSFDKFCALVRSAYSKAQWRKYQEGEIELTRQMRNELRVAIGMPALPPTVQDAVSRASPDAAVYLVGAGTIDSVVMLAGSTPVTLRCNGNVTVLEDAQNRPQSTLAVPTRRFADVCVSRATQAQNERRKALQAKWADVIEAGLRMLEMGGI